MTRRSKADVVQVNLRLREDLKQRLVREAERTGRSFNAELVQRLEESLDRVPADQVLALSHTLLKQALDVQLQAAKVRGEELATPSEHEAQLSSEAFLRTLVKESEEVEPPELRFLSSVLPDAAESVADRTERRKAVNKLHEKVTEDAKELDKTNEDTEKAAERRS